MMLHLNLNISPQGTMWEGWLWKEMLPVLISQLAATSCAQQLESRGRVGSQAGSHPAEAFIHELQGLVQERCPDTWNRPSGIFLRDAWAQLLSHGGNNHTRLPKLPWGSSKKLLLYLPPEAYPAAWGSLSRELHISATDGVATERAHNASPHFQEARRMVLPRTEGTSDSFC